MSTGKDSDTNMTIDWNKFGRPRLALFSRAVSWYLICTALLSWPFCVVLAVRDWTLIFVPLFLAVPAVMQCLTLRKVYRAEPDYARIKQLERQIYGNSPPEHS